MGLPEFWAQLVATVLALHSWLLLRAARRRLSRHDQARVAQAEGAGAADRVYRQ